MSRPGRLARWTLLAALIVALAPGGARWVLARLYPLPHREAVIRHARANGLSPTLVAAVIHTESRWQPRSTSARGARGLMQVMPETGRWVAARAGMGPVEPDDLYDAELNIRIGTWYLAYLVRQFHGSLPAALAAYNGGDGAVREWLQAGRWSGGAHDVERIPFPETRQFVRRVLRTERYYAWIYGSLE